MHTHSPSPLEILFHSSSPPPHIHPPRLPPTWGIRRFDGARATRGETNETACADSVPRVCDSLLARPDTASLRVCVYQTPQTWASSTALRAGSRAFAQTRLPISWTMAPKKEE